MTRYLIRRLIGDDYGLLLVTLLVYGLLHLAPGDPPSLLLPEDATDADVTEARRAGGSTSRSSFSISISSGTRYRAISGARLRFTRPVTGLIGSRLPATIELAFFAVADRLRLIALLPLGVFNWRSRPDSRPPTTWEGRFLGWLASSMPNFWFGIMLILLFPAFALVPLAGRRVWGRDVARRHRLLLPGQRCLRPTLERRGRRLPALVPAGGGRSGCALAGILICASRARPCGSRARGPLTCSWRAPRGLMNTRGAVAPRAAQRARSPDRDGRRPGARHAAERVDHRRDGFCLARRR